MPQPRVAAPVADDVLVDDWVRDHGVAMYRVAAAILRDRGLAEDAVQESLLKGWRAHAGSVVVSDRAWLLRITHNTAISMLRRERTTPIGEDTAGILEAAPGGDAEREAMGHQAMAALLEALRDLDPTTAAILVLREVEDLSYEDICAVTDLPLPTVKTRLHRGRQQLRAKLEGWNP